MYGPMRVVVMGVVYRRGCRASAGAVRRVEGRHTRTERQVRDGHALATTAGIGIFPLEAGSRAAGETNIAIAPPSHESQHGTERCLWMVPSSKRAGEDHTEIACLQAIVIAGQSLHVSQRHGQRHRKALRRHEQGCTIGQAQIQGVRVRVRFRPQQPIVEA
jgi:hypothetical protein